MTAAALVGAALELGIIVWLVVKYVRANDALGDSRDVVSGLRSRLSSEEQKRREAEQQRAVTWDELKQERARSRNRLNALRTEIAELERDLESCTTPSSLRSRLERLLRVGTESGGGRSPASETPLRRDPASPAGGSGGR